MYKIVNKHTNYSAKDRTGKMIKTKQKWRAELIRDNLTVRDNGIKAKNRNQYTVRKIVVRKEEPKKKGFFDWNF